MADNQENYGRPKMLGPDEHLEIVNGQFVRMPGAPNSDKGKEVVLDTGYQQNDFQAAAQAQGLGQTQPAPQQPTPTATTPITFVNTNSVAPAPVTTAPVTPVNTVVETVPTAAETAVSGLENAANTISTTGDLLNNMISPGSDQQ